METAYQKVLYNPCFLLVLRHGIQKTKEHILHKGGFVVFYSKNNFCIMIKIKLVWFYSLYRNYFFEQKCDLFIYFKNIFYLVTLKIFLENSIFSEYRCVSRALYSSPFYLLFCFLLKLPFASFLSAITVTKDWVDEVLRRVSGKVFISVVKDDISTAIDNP